MQVSISAKQGGKMYKTRRGIALTLFVCVLLSDLGGGILILAFDSNAGVT